MTSPDNHPQERPNRLGRNIAIAGGAAATVIAGAAVIDAMNGPKPPQETPLPSGIIEQSNMPGSMKPTIETTNPSGTKSTINFPTEAIPTSTPKLGPNPSPSVDIGTAETANP